MRTLAMVIVLCAASVSAAQEVKVYQFSNAQVLRPGTKWLLEVDAQGRLLVKPLVIEMIVVNPAPDPDPDPDPDPPTDRQTRLLNDGVLQVVADPNRDSTAATLADELALIPEMFSTVTGPEAYSIIVGDVRSHLTDAGVYEQWLPFRQVLSAELDRLRQQGDDTAAYWSLVEDTVWALRTSVRSRNPQQKQGN